jgi:Tfp pilus assembly protein PilF
MYFSFAVVAMAAAGYPDEAISIGREGLRLNSVEGSILVNTGVVLDHAGNHEAAEQYFLRAVNSGTEVLPQAYKNLGDQAYRRGDLSGAQTQYERAVKLNPTLGDDVFLKLGLIASETEDTEMASVYFRRAVEFNPENEEAQAKLAEISALP